MTALETMWLISSMLGGLALFLFGMNTMSDSLAAMTGGSLNRLIGKVTKNRFRAFLFGAVMAVRERHLVQVLRRRRADAGSFPQVRFPLVISCLVSSGWIRCARGKYYTISICIEEL